VQHLRGHIDPQFGTGTNLTNDLGFPALNIVIKMTRCNNRPNREVQRTATRGAFAVPRCLHMIPILATLSRDLTLKICLSNWATS